jgi:3-deoxy-D-manno-octulosonic-acid transferase
MWKVAYNLVIHLIFPFFALIALTKKKMRENFLERLWGGTNPATQPAVWIHAASIGEAVIAENLANYMSSRTPDACFTVTTNTYYARDLLRKRFGERVYVSSLPFDLPFSIKRFMKGSTFHAVILVETELWPNLIWAAHGKGIPVIIVNGRISDDTLAQYRRFSFFLKHVLAAVTLVIAQSEEQAERFRSIGMDPSRIVQAGNLKYYRFLEHPPGTSIKADTICFGSVKEKELPFILPIIEPLIRGFPGYSVYVVPRDLNLIDMIEENLPKHLRVSRFSNLKGSPPPQVDVVVVDTVGDLMTIYSHSRVAFVGGSLAPYGGQNILEPLFFGTPVLFGPHIENFREVGAMILNAKAGLMVHDGKELLETIQVLLCNAEKRESFGDAGLRLIGEQEGAMAKTVSLIMEAAWKNSPGS